MRCLTNRGAARDIERLNSGFAQPGLSGKALDRVISQYGRSLRAALGEHSAQAATIFRDYDARVLRERYELAFDPRDDEWLGG